jgi:hypothetical protein
MAKQSSPPSKVLVQHTEALRQHTKALLQHSKSLTSVVSSMNTLTGALNIHATALVTTPPATASQLVYSCLADYGLKSPVPTSTNLSDLGFDTAALAGLAADINGRKWHGVYVDTGAIQYCTTIADVIKVVTAAEK